MHFYILKLAKKDVITQKWNYKNVKLRELLIKIKSIFRTILTIFSELFQKQLNYFLQFLNLRLTLKRKILPL